MKFIEYFKITEEFESHLYFDSEEFKKVLPLSLEWARSVTRIVFYYYNGAPEIDSILICINLWYILKLSLNLKNTP